MRMMPVTVLSAAGTHDDDHDDDDGPGDFQNYLSVEPTLSRKERKTTLIWIVNRDVVV